MSDMAAPIEDYALIGDRHTAALVGRDGSIDWLCLPRFDSPACFAALLGDERPRPVAARPGRRRRGDPDATSADSPARDHLHHRQRHGDPARRHADRRRPRRRRTPGHGGVGARCGCATSGWSGATTAWSGPGSPCPPRGRGGHRRRRRPRPADAPRPAAPPRRRRPPRGRVHRRGGRGADLLDHLGRVVARPATEPIGWDDRIEATRADQEAWAATCSPDLPHADLVARSLVTLRMMTLVETGGIVAAPTTSLPEDFGGERNWDYRYCWLRDAALTLESLLDAGFTEEAAGVARLAAARGRRRPAGPADHVRRRRRPAACRSASSTTCPATPGAGRSGSATARCRSGRPTSSGEVMIALARGPRRRRSGRRGTPGRCSGRWSTTSPTTGTSRTTGCGRSAARGSTSPTPGSWSGRRSTAPCGRSSSTGSTGRSSGGGRCATRCTPRCSRRASTAGRGTFTQHYDTTEVDASLLMIPLVGFLPATTSGCSGRSRRSSRT